MRTRTRFSGSARDWKNAGRDPTYLYNVARLAVAEEWAASHPGELSIDEVEFFRCSREAQKQREATELEAARKLAEEQKIRLKSEGGRRGLRLFSVLAEAGIGPHLQKRSEHCF